MSRADNYKPTIESPVKKYLSWSSNEKCFKYYDKEQAKDVLVKLPTSFVHLDELATIKGWDEKSESGIYSNEVRSTKLEEFNVRSFKGGEIIKGIYQDVKLRIQGAGGIFHTSMYVYLNGEVVNLSFKGSALMGWSDFAKENRRNFGGNTIEILTAAEGKKGAVKFSTPVFTLGKPIGLTENEKAEGAYTLLKAYLDAKKVQPELPVEAIVAENLASKNVPEYPVLDTANDDLPF
jgi:hypothetical protein